jgi:hypothetical protein
MTNNTGNAAKTDGLDRILHFAGVSQAPDAQVPPNFASRPVALQLRKEAEQLSDYIRWITQSRFPQQTFHEAIVLPEPATTACTPAGLKRACIWTPSREDVLGRVNLSLN